MKYLSFFLLITLAGCSTTKQLTNKWIGKTDKDIVTEFGLPTIVLNDTLKGKIYKYGYIVTDSTIQNSVITVKTRKYGEVSENYPGKYPITIFFFDSLNVVKKIVLQKESKTVVNGIEI